MGGFIAVCLVLCVTFTVLAAVAANEEHSLVIGTPGGGKSYGCAWDAINYRGSAVVIDPHYESFARLVLEHDPSPNILFDRLSDLERSLSYDLLKPSTHPNLEKRRQENQRRIKALVEILMRRRGGDSAASPLLEEWVMALLTLFVSQATPKPLSIVVYGFMPGTAEFKALLRDCTAPELRFKFEQLEKLNPRGLRSEVGSAVRLVEAVFRSPSLLARCNGGFALGEFLSLPRARLIIERGEEIDEDAMRTILGAVIVLVTEFCVSRAKPFPPVRMFLDECTNARIAGDYEQKKAGETRKNGLTWDFICQWPNFIGGDAGFFQNCGRKVIYRVADYKLARRLAAIVEPGFEPTDETRAERVERITDMIMNFQPGERIVTSRAGSKLQKVPMLKNPWPDWPGLRDAKHQEKLCQIYERPEYRLRTSDTRSTGDRGTPSSMPSSPASSSPPPTSPGSSPAERFKRNGRRPPSGSADSGSGDGSGS